MGGQPLSVGGQPLSLPAPFTSSTAADVPGEPLVLSALVLASCRPRLSPTLCSTASTAMRWAAQQDLWRVGFRGPCE